MVDSFVLREFLKTVLTHRQARALQLLLIELRKPEFSNAAEKFWTLRELTEVFKANDQACCRVVLDYARTTETVASFMLKCISVDNGKMLDELLIQAPEAKDTIISRLDGKTALIHAGISGAVECVKVLLHHKVTRQQVDNAGCTALDSVKRLESMLFPSVQYPNEMKELSARRAEIIRLLSQGMDSFDSILDALKRGINLGQVDYDCQDTEGKSLLMRAFEARSKIAVRLLLAYSITMEKCDKKGQTALSYAMLTGRCDFVELLLENRSLYYGEKLKTLCEEVILALAAAAERGLTEVIDYLIARLPEDLKLEARQRAFTAALRANQKLTVKKLVAQGASPDTWKTSMPGNEHQRPVMHSTLKMAELLLSLGASAMHSDGPLFLRALACNDYRRAALLLRKPLPQPVVTYLKGDQLFLKELREHLRGPKYSSREKMLANPGLDLIMDSAAECSIFMDMLRNSPELQLYLASPSECCEQLIAKCKELTGPGDEIHITEALYEKILAIVMPRTVFGNFTMPNKLQQTMLMWACIFGHREVVEKLVTSGLPRKFINAQDCYGRTALMYALLYGNVDCALLLIDHKRYHQNGMPVLVTTQGKPILVTQDNKYVLEDGTPVLAEQVHHITTDHCGSGIHLYDAQYRTALFYALYAGLVDDTSIENIKNGEKDGEDREISAVDYSMRFGAQKIINLLIARKVKFSPLAQVTAMAFKMAVETGKDRFAIKYLLREAPQKVFE